MKNLILVVLISSATLIYFSCKSIETINIKSVKKILVPPPKQLPYFTLGYDEAIADALWLRFLQDSGTCDQQLSPDTTRVGLGRAHNCKEGWGYQMLRSIIDLTPRNRITYAAGSVLLSVVIDDIVGAKQIYDLAVYRFPQDLEIRYNAGSFYLTELGDREKAAENFKAALNLGAPAWVGSLAAKLYSEIGRLQVAERMLEVFLDKNKNVKFRDRVEMRLKAVRKQIAEEEAKGM